MYPFRWRAAAICDSVASYKVDTPRHTPILEGRKLPPARLDDVMASSKGCSPARCGTVSS